MSTFCATMKTLCKCSAEVHIVLECEDNPKRLTTIAVTCWDCASVLGHVPAINVWTAPTAEEARNRCQSGGFPSPEELTS